MSREWIDDVVPEDEDTPEFQEEMFEIYKHRGYTPADIRDKEESERYGLWLRTRVPEQ